MAGPQSQRFQQLVRRGFSLKSGYDPSVLEDFMPTFELSHPLELDRLRLAGNDLCSGALTFTAAALNFSQFAIQAVPNTICIVKRIFLGGAANTTYRGNWLLNSIFTPGLGPTQAVSTDTRAHPPGAVTGAAARCSFSSGNVGVLPVGPTVFLVPTGLPWFDVDLVLFGAVIDPKADPGASRSTMLLITQEQAASLATFSWFGFVRSLEPSEQF